MSLKVWKGVKGVVSAGGESFRFLEGFSEDWLRERGGC